MELLADKLPGIIHKVTDIAAKHFGYDLVDPEKIPLHGITGMYFEGLATYYSKKFVPDIPEHIYYLSEENWLAFCEENQKK